MSRKFGTKNLDQVTEDAIRVAYEEHPSYHTKQIRLAARAILQEKGIKVDVDFVSDSAIRKRLGGLRKNVQANPLDAPWDVSALSKYPLSPEAVPIVLQMMVDLPNEHKPLTIRQALWVDRFHVFLKGWDLYDFARLYALQEKIAESGKPLYQPIADDEELYSAMTGSEYVLRVVQTGNQKQASR